MKDFLFDIRVEPSNQARAMKIMEAVSTALKSRAFQIRVEGEKKTSAEKDGVSVQFHIEELYKQITKTESWGSDSTRTYTHIVGREPLGRLALMLDDWAGQFRRSFKDGKRQRVENTIQEFVETVEQVVVFRKQQAAEYARWERERQEQRARKELEEARVKALERQLDLISTARNLNEYLTRLSSQPDSDVKDAWIRWVKGLVTSLAGRFNAQVKVSHVMRALVGLLLHAEGEIDKRAGEVGSLIRPPNGDAQALQRFEQEIGKVIASGLRDAGPIR